MDCTVCPPPPLQRISLPCNECNACNATVRDARAPSSLRIPRDAPDILLDNATVAALAIAAASLVAPKERTAMKPILAVVLVALLLPAPSAPRDDDEPALPVKQLIDKLKDKDAANRAAAALALGRIADDAQQ